MTLTLLLFPKVGYHQSEINMGQLLRSELATIVEILFPKETLRARALEKIPPHEIEVSEGVSIFIKKRKINILLPYRIKDGQISLKFQFLREGP